jgi:nicotinate-nucleotide adenylyltransferase
MKIGLLFGSFNPLHIGHLAIANYMAEFTDLQQVWLVVSPRNPLKSKSFLTDAHKRLALVKKAVGVNKKIKVCALEFSLPQPSYTINTLELLNKKHPNDEFVLIIGSDNLITFHKWKDYKKILSEYKIYVYPRLSPSIKQKLKKISTIGRLKNHPHIKLVNAPIIDVSSTFIRKAIKKGKNMNFFVY